MPEIIADFRSDTVTQPHEAMRNVMTSAPVGDDVFGEDPTVNTLEAKVAQLAGMEAGLFVCTGTQSNLLALLSHCERGDEYIAGQEAHTYKYEAGGAAVLGGIQPQPIEFEADATLDFGKVEARIKPDDFHFARTKLLCLENTHGGKVLPLAYHAQARQFVNQHNLALHLDGARVFHAVVKQKVPLIDITRHYDSVSICLSKGLGAPVGSVLCGSKDFIAKARRLRKMVGGGMRQAGILAAAGLYALENNIERLADDHHHARILAEGLSELPGITSQPDDVQTNILYITLSSTELANKLRAHLAEEGITLGGGTRIRMVTHMDINRAAIEKTLNAFKNILSKGFLSTQ